MLEKCAPGHHRRETKHHWVIRYEGTTYRRLPKGQHSRQQSLRGDVDAFHVKAMCRRLGILDCAKRELEQLP
jgi:hypothetical protein